MDKLSLKPLVIALISGAMLFNAGCSTLTGIPSHGGGKRFAEEQRLVSASIRGTLRNIDVSSLQGRKVAVVFDLISDEGGGNISGGRLNILGGLSSGHVISPVTSTVGQFQIFNLAEIGSNYSNTSTGVNSSNASTTMIVQNNQGSGTNTATTSGTVTSNTTSSDSTNSTGTQNTTNNIGGSSTTVNNSGSTTTTNNPAVTTITQTNNVVTTQNTHASTGTQMTSPSTSTHTTSPQTNTSTTQSNNTATTSGRSENQQAHSSTTNGSNTNQSTTEGKNTTTGTETTNSNAETNGKNQIQREVASSTPQTTKAQTTGNEQRANVALQYQGLGTYENLAIPKSDAALLTGLVRNYLILNGVHPTTPTDPEADAILYVTVDIFGIVRSRFEGYVFNRESVIAETAIEMMAFDRSGRMIMRPTSANHEAKYDENYVLWTGPYKTNEKVRKGKGLLIDFSDVDGRQAIYPSEVQRSTYKNNAQ